MRFGVCAGIEQAEAIAEAGYDYIELPAASSLIPDEDDSLWAEKRRLIEQMPLRPETFNLFLRGVHVTGPEVDGAQNRSYVAACLSRAAQIGGQVVVFGSSGARNIPEGFPREVAERQMLEFLSICADEAERCGVTVAMEPLCRKESNFINLVTEGAELARRVHRPGVRNLADTYHMEMEGEPFEAIIETANVLAHVHTADSLRRAPGTGSVDYVGLFRALRKAGYDRRLSIECDWTGQFASLVGPALDVLKTACAASA